MNVCCTYTHYACRPHLRLATFHFISTLLCALGSLFGSFLFLSSLKYVHCSMFIFLFMFCVFLSASKQIGSYGVYSVFITNYYSALYDFSIWLIFRIASHSCKTCMTICFNSAFFFFFFFFVSAKFVLFRAFISFLSCSFSISLTDKCEAHSTIVNAHSLKIFEYAPILWCLG